MAGEYYIEAIGKRFVDENVDLLRIVDQTFPQADWGRRGFEHSEERWDRLYLDFQTNRKSPLRVVRKIWINMERSLTDNELAMAEKYQGPEPLSPPQSKPSLTLGVTLASLHEDLQQDPWPWRARLRATLDPIRIDPSDLDSWVTEAIVDPLVDSGLFEFARVHWDEGLNAPLHGADLINRFWANCTWITYCAYPRASYFDELLEVAVTEDRTGKAPSGAMSIVRPSGIVRFTHGVRIHAQLGSAAWLYLQRKGAPVPSIA